jgi:hypothetical protein
MTDRPFTPGEDTAQVINRLLDIYERRGGQPKQVVRLRLRDIGEGLPGYYSQVDPLPRTVTNEQLTALMRRGWVALHWEPGQEEHLLAAVDLAPEAGAEAVEELVAGLYALVEREPLAAQRRRLRNLLLGQRFRVHDWRRPALDGILDRLEAGKSPTPFSLGDEDWNRDVMEALLALPQEPVVEMPYRVFSVRVFNDSKRFDVLKRAVARLARRHHSEWRGLTNREALRELGLVPNPSHLYLAGPWRLTSEGGAVAAVNAFSPSVGIPAAMAARVSRVRVDADRVICVENLTPFYELVRRGGEDLATLCLLGNPSPACRHLLRRLVEDLPGDIPLYVWADLDYGGLNILSHVRRTVSRRFRPYRMDTATLEAFAYWGQPLTNRDRRNLQRLRDDPHLADMVDVIDALLTGEVKLEQEAIVLREV